ncbi:NAD+ kinase [Oceanotoga teriensis]|uniref:NAD kinase n=1 Tax=Oceanotoga teriensis TaxID=515440 RepID=A0AA45C8T8_9BACT|nr:NAD+ kinase [Oceanotoga teriensis]
MEIVWGEILKIILFFNPTKHNKEYIEKNISYIFESNNIEVLDILSASSFVNEKIANSADFYVVLGGDGTVLRISQIATFHNKPIISINLGTLGFLSAYSREEIELAALDIKNKNLKFSSRYLIKCNIDGKNIIALNDFVIQKSQPVGTIDLEVKVANHILYSFLGDGIIISTPTGATGYALSSGGSIIDPDLNMMELVPLSPHALNIRPFIVSPNRSIEININNISAGFSYITGDGNIIKKLEPGTSIKISGSEKRILLAQKNTETFYSTLNKKLAFGRRFE